MILKINGEEVSWSDLEATNLRDTLTEIQNWLHSQGWRMTAFNAGQPVTDPALVPLASVEVLEIQADPLNRPLLTHLDLLILWLDSLGHGLISGNPEVHRRCVEAAPQVRDSLDLLRRAGLSLPADTFDPLIGVLPQGWDAVRAYQEDIDRVQAQLERLKTLLLYPLDAVRTLVQTLERRLTEAENLPAWVYAQRHQDVIQAIVSLLDVYSLLVMGLSQVRTEGLDLSVQSELLPFLNELSEAMARLDWTYLSDLWEYEIHPRLTKLLDSAKMVVGMAEDAAQRN